MITRRGLFGFPSPVVPAKPKHERTQNYKADGKISTWAEVFYAACQGAGTLRPPYQDETDRIPWPDDVEAWGAKSEASRRRAPCSRRRAQ
jgi:hypothetical protein